MKRSIEKEFDVGNKRVRLNKEADRTELLLENQRLQMERKHKIEINRMKLVEMEMRGKMETLKLKWEMETLKLRTKIELLENEIRSLKKETSTVRFRGLNKSEVNRRRRKFPWLPLNLIGDKAGTHSTQRRKVVGWKDVPTDVIFHIFQFIPFEDLFDLRGLNTQFYEGFYNIDGVPEDSDMLIIRLAKHGRRFTNISILKCDILSLADTRAIGSTTFPQLQKLFLWMSCPRGLKINPKLWELRFCAKTWRDIKFVTPLKFPALEYIILYHEETTEWEQCNRVANLPGHKSLVAFCFDCCRPPSLEEVREFTNAKFPALQTVGVHPDAGPVAPEVVDYLQRQGIELATKLF